MNAHPTRRWLPALVACVLFAGILTPIVALGQGNGGQQQMQLSTLVAAAESSRSYASNTVDYASASGLSVAAAQAQLSKGDSMLTTAKSDLQTGTDLAGGLDAVQAAMSDYAAAATSASLALGDAGLTATVDYGAVVSAVAEANATAGAVASVAAQACAGAAASSSGSQAVAQACAETSANLTSARTHLGEAASLLAQSSGRAAASANISQALSLVAQARSDVEACQPLLLTIASYTYSQRGQAYVSAVLDPLYIKANATVQAEQSVVANLTTFQADWAAYSQSQASATANINLSASDLEGVISQVDIGSVSVSASISTAQSTEAEVNSEMTALLGISGVVALPGVVTDVDTCVSAADSYASALVSTRAWSSAYAQTSLSGFGAYLSTGTSNASAAQSSGSAYVAAFNRVVADLSGLLGVPGVQAIYSILVGLPVSGSVSGVNASLQQETGTMGTVQADISSLNAAVSSGQSTILVNGTLLAEAASVSEEGASYLNATATAAMGAVNASVWSASRASLSYVSTAQASLRGSVGAFSNSAASVATSGASLKSQTQGAASATATAASNVRSDSRIRSSEAAAGRADSSQALELFSIQDVSAGVAAMSQAYVEFQAA